MIVNYKEARALFCEGVRLLPGKNDLDEASVKRMLQNPLFRWRIDKGFIVIQDYEKLTQAEERPASSKEEEQKKIDVIKNSVSTDSVKKMIKKEKSSKVIDAAEEKLEKLEEAEKVRDRKFNPLRDAKEVEPTKENGFTAEVGVI